MMDTDSNLSTTQAQEDAPSEEAHVRFHKATVGKSSGFNIRVNATLQGWCIGAALLPSLKAQYKVRGKCSISAYMSLELISWSSS